MNEDTPVELAMERLRYSWRMMHEGNFDSAAKDLVIAVRAEERQRVIALIKMQPTSCGSRSPDGPCCISAWDLEQAVGNV